MRSEKDSAARGTIIVMAVILVSTVFGLTKHVENSTFRQAVDPIAQELIENAGQPDGVEQISKLCGEDDILVRPSGLARCSSYNQQAYGQGIYRVISVTVFSRLPMDAQTIVGTVHIETEQDGTPVRIKYKKGYRG